MRSSSPEDGVNRPQSYFWPITHDTHVIAAIKGERRRSAIRNAFDAGQVELPRFRGQVSVLVL